MANPNPTFGDRPNKESELGKLSDRTFSVRIPQWCMVLWDRLPSDERVVWARRVIVKAFKERFDKE